LPGRAGGIVERAEDGGSARRFAAEARRRRPWNDKVFVFYIGAANDHPGALPGRPLVSL